MSDAVARRVIPATEVNRLRDGREILQREAEALQKLAQQLDAKFAAAVDILLHCRGNIIVTGVGKAGLVGQKIAATLSSLGCPAHFMHPTEAVHGDLGCLHPDDVILALSNSGESAEIVALLPALRERELPLIAITAEADNTLSQHATVTVTTGRLTEAGELALAPTTSTTAMMALGDALALVTSQTKSYTAGDFSSVHPAGKIGARLKRVQEIMRPPGEIRIASESRTVRDLLVQVARPGRRSGAVLLVEGAGRLTGLFTDSDLARLLEQRQDDRLDRPAREIMTPNPVTIGPDARVSSAIELLSSRKLSELPVVDNRGTPVGLLDITDLIGLGVVSASDRPQLTLADPGDGA